MKNRIVACLLVGTIGLSFTGCSKTGPSKASLEHIETIDFYSTESSTEQSNPSEEASSNKAEQSNPIDELALRAEDSANGIAIVAQTLADKLDAETVKVMLDAGTADCDAARSLEADIDSFMSENSNITYAYLIATKGDDGAQFLVNWEDSSEYWGDDFDMYEKPAEALRGNISYDENPTTGKDGTVISGYAPIKDTKDQVIAVACVDMAVAPEKTADLIIYGDIQTNSEAEPTAEVFAVTDGKFSYVGLAGTRALEYLEDSHTQLLNHDYDKIEAEDKIEFGEPANFSITDADGVVTTYVNGKVVE